MGRSHRPALLVIACATTAVALIGLDRRTLVGRAQRVTNGSVEASDTSRAVPSPDIAEGALGDEALTSDEVTTPDRASPATPLRSNTAATAAAADTAPPSVAPPTPSVAPPQLSRDNAWQHHGLVAHAFGATLDRTTYTNSEEAIRLSHGYGFRVFEVDMMLLKDRKVALVHDEFEGRYGVSRQKTFSGYTQDELEGKRFDGKYPMLFGDDLIRLMKVFPDSYFILDTKGSHVEIARWFVRHMEPALLDRLRPHVHHQQQIDELRSLYDWKGMVIATYTMGAEIQAKTLELAAVNGINTVMVRGSEYSEAMRKELAAQGVQHVFIHDARNENEARRWRSMGLGVYSHYWVWM